MITLHYNIQHITTTLLRPMPTIVLFYSLPLPKCITILGEHQYTEIEPGHVGINVGCS